MNFIIEIPGPPLAQKRPKFARRGKFVQVYSASKKDQDAVRAMVAKLWKNEKIISAVELDIVFYMPIPASWSKKKRMESAGKPHVNTADLDNILKLYLDSINNLVYADDRQIYKIHAQKIYDENPRTEINVVWQG